MNRFTLALVALALVVVSTRGEDADARKIVDAALKATGANGKMPAVSWKGKGKFYGMGDGIDYTGTWSTHMPDKFRMEIENAFVIVVNGDKGWFGGEEMGKDQLAEQKESMYASWVLGLHPLSDKAFTLKAIGEDKVGDKAVVGVKVSHKDRRDVSRFFDKDSHLVVKIEQMVKEMGNEMKQETVINEWAKVGDVKVPGKMTIKRDGKLYVEGEMSDYQATEKHPEKTFEKP
jgi:outer membrane lipoprotein-sorting protein